ncbi:MAG: NapC/NirT family cytochrome c [Gammaproteobacteria bacterium]|nr:NapC/NirT family cytochrome c [Gammaproteobacteria bacterium]
MSSPFNILFITRNVLIALVIGGFGGMGFILFLIEFDHHTSSEEFCTTCHSMELVALPYRQSSHYNPESGVRASCGDCHVSEGVLMATWDHTMGSKDLFKQLFSSVDYDDPVENLLHLPQAAFAAREWFRARQSSTCSRCHTLEAIMGDRPAIAQIHREESGGKSCVDCHINLVHRPVPSRKTFNQERWNRMVEEEFNLATGEAAKRLAP